MVKTVIKEIFITILLCAILVLVLAVVFYDYIPINKTIPEPVKYTMPEELSDIKEELLYSIDTSDENTKIETITLDEEDLAIYKQTKSYDAGKANPFEEYSEEPEQGTTDEKQENPTPTKSSGTLFDDGTTK